MAGIDAVSRWRGCAGLTHGLSSCSLSSSVISFSFFFLDRVWVLG
jgi:hypothetical protein